MSNEDAPQVPNASLTDGSRRYDKILEGFSREQREDILVNVATIERWQPNETMKSIEVGNALSEIKKACRGNKDKFKEIVDEANVTPRMIQHQMRVAERFYDVRKLVCDLPLNVLIRLAAKATPESLVEWVIQEKQAGKSIDLTALKGKLDATRKNRPPSLKTLKSSSEEGVQVAPASTNEEGACPPLSQIDQVSDEAADAGATMSGATVGPTVADDSVGGTPGVVTGDENQPSEGRVFRLEERTSVGAGEDRSVTAAHNAANMLMSNDPVDPYELANQLEAADAMELKKLLIAGCSKAKAA
ncbi:hypothetical protein [Methylobacterium radiotolerans]|uniref:hypothetical protein n=1 Tax=Methylobacterium radiotolerans TaxID=31998 RepID=UPI0015F485E6|nr:hypothetical protein [Methylobacterium radiotolerans]